METFTSLRVKFAERMRPRRPWDLFLPRRDIEAIEEVIATRQAIDMIFSGPPGHGKTSTVEMITTGIDAHTVTFYGSRLKDKVLEQVIEFSSLMAYWGPKICVIEEADHVPAGVQASLRGVVENYTQTRFLFTTNNYEDLDEPLRSRLYHIDFTIPEQEHARVKRRLSARYRLALAASGVATNAEAVANIIERFFPDLRAAANAVDTELFRARSAEPIRLPSPMQRGGQYGRWS